jgi:hypothetical protein
MAVQAAAAGAPASAPSGAGANPFWQATNLFGQKNMQGAVTGFTPGASTLAGGGQINPGNFLRGLRLVVATTAAGSAMTLTPDAPWNLFANLGLQNTDGSEILYNTISGYGYFLANRYFRPWLRDPSDRSNFLATATSIAFTLFLQPEIRQQAGVLENTDSRSQYSWTQVLGVGAAIASLGTGGAYPTLSVTPYVDMWAQPDMEDLEGVPNTRIPPGANLQTKLRHQTFTLNAAGSTNDFLSTMTGNAVRGILAIVRDSTGARQDYLSDPIHWQLDQRNLGVTSPEQWFEWAEDFYTAGGHGQSPAGWTRPQGVYPFLRFYNPGALYGQSWLYTSNATELYMESATASNAVNVPGTVEFLQEEVFAVGPVDPSLIDL